MGTKSPDAPRLACKLVEKVFFDWEKVFFDWLKSFFDFCGRFPELVDHQLRAAHAAACAVACPAAQWCQKPPPAPQAVQPQAPAAATGCFDLLCRGPSWVDGQTNFMRQRVTFLQPPERWCHDLRGSAPFVPVLVSTKTRPRHLAPSRKLDPTN